MAARIISYLRELTKTITPKQALSLIDIHLAVNQNAHFNIVKLRAARMIINNICRAFNADNPPPIKAISSNRMLAGYGDNETPHDPWVNILRLGSAGFGAATGGADYICLHPFTRKLGLANPVARRISRNIQLLLMQESNFGRVNDPASGSFMHESLSHELAKKAWELFQTIEANGGWYDYQDEFMQMVKQTKKTREQKTAKGEIKLLGINQYINPDIRKAGILPRPKPRKLRQTAKIINSEDFAEAISQAKTGYVLAQDKGGQI